MSKGIIKGLQASEFQHPEDKKALDFLESIKILDVTLETILKYTSEAMMKFVKAGSCIEINEEQYPSVYRIFVECCKILDIEKIPVLYLDRGGVISTNVDGITEPIVLITGGAISTLSEEELYFLFGQALGQIKAGHLKYHKVAELLTSGGLSEVIGVSIASIKKELLSWYRVSVLSSDRAGMLCCQSRNTAMSVLAKMTGYIRNSNENLDIEVFIEQPKKFKQKQDENSFWKDTHYLFNSVKTPLTVLRAANLLEWIDQGGYEKIMECSFNPDGLIPKVPSETKVCSNCGFDKVPASSFICPECGMPA